MYVLADLEWVENEYEKISFSQIAMIRVDEDWNVVSTIFHRIKPLNVSYHRWNHVGYTGGAPIDYLTASDSTHVFEDVATWLCPDDIICWWASEAKDWVQKLLPAITNQQIVLAEHVTKFVGHKPCNAHKLGRYLNLESAGENHNAQSDAEMMRRVLATVHFPQPIPKNVDDIKPSDRVGAQAMAYNAHIDTNTIHKKGCPQIPVFGHLKGYNDLKKPVGKKYIPCDCVKTEFTAARRLRNQDIIDRSEYNYLYTPNSAVFHRRDCKIMLQAHDVLGAVLYGSCLSTDRRPCKVCNPTVEGEVTKKRFKHQMPTKRGPTLSDHEQRAVNRHRQAQEQRRAIERNANLSQEKRDDLYILSQPGYAFFAAKGYKNFHLRNCKSLSGISNVEGFAWYKDATRAGYRPCKCCKPDPKHDVVVSLPIYSSERRGESASAIRVLCERFGYKYRTDEKYTYVETEVGIWRIDTANTPYRLDHINLISTPDNRTNFHRQPRLFLSLRDVVYYIKRHDESLSFTWTETAYVPKEATV